MPIDSGVYDRLGQQPQGINQPFANLQQVMNLRQQQQVNQALEQERQSRAAETQQQTLKLQQQQQDQQDFASSLQAGNGIRAATMDYALKNHPKVAPDIQKYFDTTEESANKIKQQQADLQAKQLETQKGQLALRDSQLNHIGQAADDLLPIIHALPPEQWAGTAALAIAHHAELFPEDAPQATQLAQQMQGASPAQVEQFLQQQVNAAPYKQAEKQKAAAELAAPYTLKPGEVRGANGQTIQTAGPEPITPYQQADLSIKRGELGLKEKQFNATFGSNLHPDGTPMSKDEIAQAAANDPQASMIASYQVAPPSSRIEADPKYAGLFSRIKALNPDYDSSQFAIRAPARKAFTVGTQGQQLGAMNTAVQHLDLLSQAADALKNGTLTPANALYNKVAAVFGAPQPNNFNQIKHYVDGEVGNVVTKGAVTVNEMQQQGQQGSNAASPEQLKDYINNAIQIMAAKTNTLHYQAQQALGANDPAVQKMVMPEVASILQKRGFTAEGKPTAPAASAGGRIRVKGPNGESGTVPDDGKPLPAGWSKVGG